MTALGRGLGSGRIEQEGKRTHGHGQQCSDYQGRGMDVGGRGFRGDKW